MTDQLLPRPMYTVLDIAEILQVSKMTVYRRIHDKELPAFRIGRSYRVDPRDLADFMRSSDTRRGAA